MNRLALQALAGSALDTDREPVSYVGWRTVAYGLGRGEAGNPDSLTPADERAVERQMQALRAASAIRTREPAQMQRTASHDLAALLAYMPPRARRSAPPEPDHEF